MKRTLAVIILLLILVSIAVQAQEPLPQPMCPKPTKTPDPTPMPTATGTPTPTPTATATTRYYVYMPLMMLNWPYECMYGTTLVVGGKRYDVEATHLPWHVFSLPIQWLGGGVTFDSPHEIWRYEVVWFEHYDWLWPPERGTVQFTATFAPDGWREDGVYDLTPGRWYMLTAWYTPDCGVSVLLAWDPPNDITQGELRELLRMRGATCR